MLNLVTFTQYTVRSLSQINSQENEIKGMGIVKEKVLSLLVHDIILYIRNSKNFTKKTVRTNKWIQPRPMSKSCYLCFVFLYECYDFRFYSQVFNLFWINCSVYCKILIQFYSLACVVLFSQQYLSKRLSFPPCIFLVLLS